MNDGPLAGVDDSDYFGYRNLDEQEITVDALTATFNHDFNDSMSLRNLSRWQGVAQYSQTSAPQGTFAWRRTGLQPVGADGAATVGLPCPAGLAPGFFLPSGPARPGSRPGERVAPQPDRPASGVGDSGGLRNTLVVGASFTREDYDITTASLLRNADGSAVVPLPIEIIAVGPDIYTRAAEQDGHRTSRELRRATSRSTYSTRSRSTRSSSSTAASGSSARRRVPQRPARHLSARDGAADAAAARCRRKARRPVLLSRRRRVQADRRHQPLCRLRQCEDAVVSDRAARLRRRHRARRCESVRRCAGRRRATTRSAPRRICSTAGCSSTAALFRNERSNFRVASNDPVAAGARRCSTGGRGSTASRSARRGNITARVDGVRQLHLSGQRGAAEHLGLLPRQSRRGRLQQQRRGPRSAGAATGWSRRRGIRAACSPPIGSRSGSRSATASPIRAASRPISATCSSAPNISPTTISIHRVFLSYAFDNGLTAQLNVQNRHRREILHRRAQQRERDDRRDHRRVGDARRGTLGGAELVLQLLRAQDVPHHDARHPWSARRRTRSRPARDRSTPATGWTATSPRATSRRSPSSTRNCPRTAQRRARRAAGAGGARAVADVRLGGAAAHDLPAAVQPLRGRRGVRHPCRQRGAHPSAAREFRIRSDLSATLFLAEPDDYDGGELLVEDSSAPERSSCRPAIWCSIRPRACTGSSR